MDSGNDFIAITSVQESYLAAENINKGQINSNIANELKVDLRDAEAANRNSANFTQKSLKRRTQI